MSLQKVKPRNARTKRILEKRDPQIHENPKTTLFLKGTSCSSLASLVLTDLHSLKRPQAIKFTKKNAIHPFDDASSLEFFSAKNDAALLLFGNSSKKRPHSITLARMFDHALLDMLELLVVPDTLRTLAQFKTRKPAVGLRPLLAFSGAAFESPVASPYTLARSLFIDLLRGEEAAGKVDVAGLQYLVHISTAEAGSDAGEMPPIHFRVYLLSTKRAGGKVPRVEVEEMGPRIDFRVGRTRVAEPDMMKEALKTPKGLEARAKKNVETDLMGDKVGRIHMGKQDLGKMQTRKMKGLKRGREEFEGEDAATMVGDTGDGIDGDEEDGGVPVGKKERVA
ncbi:Brix-domain-containing protein [Pseudovirgaria hyperparasitica]|uniref:Ribosome production factor 2 homolog n=1 Tax=Pseudovirgaria hyperparasitica TaxID=470096 RepID=A0A6A6W3Y8_9PEZI|nr:Brix-domain-containing protein [Pseudovirgaria hyperparasitica]KAF2756744.1 Brix-domain-containing protein [Pseudovirgaria hyperparasitica]